MKPSEEIDKIFKELLGAERDYPVDDISGVMKMNIVFHDCYIRAIIKYLDEKI